MDAITGAARFFTAISAVREMAPAQKSEAQSSSAPVKPAPVTDQYVPEEEHTPSGLYWIGKDEDGTPKVYFDAPDAKPTSGGKAEQCTTNTDAVDRELEKLRRRQEELEQQLGTEVDPAKAQALEKKLAQVESELAQKDNDTYRRQNAVIS